MKNILVTGGCGYIGSHVSEYLLNDGYKVTVVDNMSVGTRNNVRPKIEVFEVDVRSEEDMKIIFGATKPDAVVHLAASKRNSDPNLYSVNVEGTKIISNLCQEFKCKFIHASSAAVYGGYTPYAVSKREAEI